jgi:hypothetical protein
LLGRRQRLKPLWLYKTVIEVGEKPLWSTIWIGELFVWNQYFEFSVKYLGEQIESVLVRNKKNVKIIIFRGSDTFLRTIRPKFKKLKF